MIILETRMPEQIAKLHAKQLGELNKQFTEAEIVENWLQVKDALFILVKDPEPIAFAAFIKNESHVYLSDLYVEPEKRNFGHAKNLIKALKNKKQKIELEVEIKNTSALGLYRAEGFQMISEEKNGKVRLRYCPTSRCT
jgi:ribosomal protein S18 acetylase RimI-like enzyme